MIPEKTHTQGETSPWQGSQVEILEKRRLALSVSDTPVGFAIFHLDENHLPVRIELFQRSARQTDKAFEINIIDKSLRAFFDPETLQEINGNSVSSILSMSKAAYSYARAQGLTFPTEERQSDKYSLCSLNVKNSSDTITYISNHIPLSIEEWTYGHKRHQVTTARRDCDGNLLAELQTKSLEYPDGSIVLDVIIVSFMKDHATHTPHHFRTSARGPSALSVLSIGLENLHSDIAELPIQEFLAPYFSSAKRGESYQSNSFPHVQKPSYYHSQIEDSGMVNLTDGAKVAWDFDNKQGRLAIYPQGQAPSYQILFIQQHRFSPPSTFLNIVADILSENQENIHHALNKLSSHSYLYQENHLNRTRHSDVLTDHLIEEFGLKRLAPISPNEMSDISSFDRALAALEGKEWIGFQIPSESQNLRHLDIYIPNAIYLRVWQGACDKIIITSRSIYNSINKIDSHGEPLASGSIPEMRASLGQILKEFSDNPFQLFQRFARQGADLSPIFGEIPNSENLSRLNFFSRLLIEESSRVQQFFTCSANDFSRPLLDHIARHSDVSISTDPKLPFGLHLDFHGAQLVKIEVVRKVGFYESFLRIKDYVVVKEKQIPSEQNVTPAEVLNICRNLMDQLNYYYFDKKTTRLSAKLIEQVDQILDDFTNQLRRS